MKLKKELVDEVIRLTKKFYKIGDTDILSAVFNAKEVFKKSVSWQAVDLVEDIAKFTQRSGKGTYEDIYKALAIFGVIVE